MDRLYNKSAGGSPERIAAQSDGVFAAAMTLTGTYWSIGFIVLMQMNYAIAPRQFFAGKP